MDNETGFIVGKMYYSIGLNMQCYSVLTRVKLVEIFDKPDEYGRDCIIESGKKRPIQFPSELKTLHNNRPS
jgi:hypothetical protein